VPWWLLPLGGWVAGGFPVALAMGVRQAREVARYVPPEPSRENLAPMPAEAAFWLAWLFAPAVAVFWVLFVANRGVGLMLRRAGRVDRLPVVLDAERQRLERETGVVPDSMECEF
jgi:hypothetical protein